MSVNGTPPAVHLVGVGGVGMSAIALVLASRGHRVSGSDRAASRITARLAELGVRIDSGHAASNVGDAQMVIISTAIRPENPEIIEAQRLGIPVVHRSEALASILDAGVGVAITGTHGKTTTTGLAAMAFERAGLDPTVLVGGELFGPGGTARVGQGEHIIAEVDESDGSLLRIHPMWTIVTNLEMEHHDHYRDEAHLSETFSQFLAQVRDGGGAVLCHDDPRLAPLRAVAPCRVWSHSLADSTADYHATDLRISTDGPHFAVESRDEGRLCDVALSVPGLHNVLNATAVVALAHRMGLELDTVAAGLGEFRGVRRRFDRRGTAQGVTVIDDYAHHPTELRATLETARTMYPEGRLVAVFQPHRYSRTRGLWREFAGALGKAVDHLVITEIYPAGEAPIEGVSARMICDALENNGTGEWAYCPTLDEVVAHLRETVRPGDCVLTLGAGDVWQAGEALLEQLGCDSSVPA